MKLIADVDYFGIVHRRAERIRGVWYFERPFGEVYPFVVQQRVKVLTVLKRPTGAGSTGERSGIDAGVTVLDHIATQTVETPA
jgi:hypothetical protein